jgi:hypothetical protein
MNSNIVYEWEVFSNAKALVLRWGWNYKNTNKQKKGLKNVDYIVQCVSQYENVPLLLKRTLYII